MGGIAAFTVLCALLLYRFAFMDAEKTLAVTISAEPDSGVVVFRGAISDELWLNCNDIITENNGWIENTADKTYTAANGASLKLLFPTRKNIRLVFNAGPGCGKVRGYNSDTGEELFFNLYAENDNLLGNQYPVATVNAKETTLLTTNQIAALALLCIATLFLCGIALMRISGKWEKKNENTRGKRNASVEFCRFFAIMCVVVHHYASAYSPGGYLGVDFFSILAGFFLMRHFNRHHGSDCEACIEAVGYIKERYIRIIPFYLCSAACMVVIGSIVIQSFISLPKFICYSIWELLMLDGFGFTGNLIIGPGWYLQSLFLASFVIYFLLCMNKRLFINILFPLGFCFLFSFLSKAHPHLNVWLTTEGIIPHATIRVFAEIGLGCICYEVYGALKAKFPADCSIRNMLVHTLVEVICIMEILYIVFRHAATNADFSCVLFMAVLIVSLFMERSLISKVLNNSLSRYLGKISVCIYLTHIMIVQINWVKIIGLSWKKSSVCYLLIVIAFSCITTAFVECIVQKIQAARIQNA